MKFTRIYEHRIRRAFVPLHQKLKNMNYMSNTEEDIDRYEDDDYSYDAYEGESRTYDEFAGSYAQDVMGYSDEEIYDVFDGEPDAYWNID